MTAESQTSAEPTAPDSTPNPATPSGKPVHPNVVAAGWVSFFTDLGSEMIYPLLPMLITGQGPGQLGASKTMLGLIEGMAEATPSLFKLGAGLWADRVRNRKWLILLGYGISSLFKPFIGLAATSLQVLGLRFADRVGKGIRSAPRDALIADSADPTDRGRSFGFQRAMDHLGALGGGLVAWLLLSWLGLLPSTVIVVSVVPGLLCLLTIFVLVQEVPNREVRSAPIAPSDLLRQARDLPAGYWRLLVGTTGFAIANSSDAFLLLRAQEMGVSVAMIPLIWSYLHLIKAATSYQGGRLADRIGARPLMIGGWLLYSGVYLGFGLADGPFAAWLLFTVYGFFFGATEGTLKSWVAHLVPADRRGAAYGWLGLAEGLALLPAGLLTGFLWDRYGSLPALATASALAVLATLWVWLAVPKTSSTES